MNGNCKFCGKECKNVKVHERFCKSNPDKIQTPVVKSTEEMAKPEQIQDQPDKQTSPVIISGITDINTLMNAWYDVDGEVTHLPIEVAGILKAEGQEISWGLVMGSNGILLPPYMLPGFICVSIHPPNMKTKKEDTDDEPFPPFPEEVEEKPTHITEDNKEPDNNITTEHKSHIETIPSKKGLLDFMRRKPKPKPCEYKPVSSDTRNLLAELSEV